MIAAKFPHNEPQRLKTLRKYQILDTQPEVVFDEIARLASSICKTPIALITLVDSDRQWFKSRVGLDVVETPRDLAFCSHAILEPGKFFLVEDTHQDERFADNPLVTNDPNIRFYAGFPISAASGEALGTLCVIDRKPGSLSPEQRDALRVLATQVNAQLELRDALRKTIENDERHDREIQKRLTAGEATIKELADVSFALDQHAIVAVTDVQGTITHVNDKFCAISKYSKEELLGQNHRILNSGHHPKEFFQQMYSTIANGNVWHSEICNRAKDGTLYWVDTTVVPFMGGDGKPRQYVAIRADITERKRAEEALRVSLAASEVVVKELADQKFALDQHAIVAVTDVQGTITYVNDKFCAISKYSREELLGQNHRILNSGHHPKEFFQQMYSTIANGNVWYNEICNRAKDDSLYWVDTTIVPFRGPEGKPRQYVAIRADITERKRFEEALKVSLDASEIAVKELLDLKFALDQHAIVGVTDVQGTITYVNEKFCAISKYSREELLGQNHRILNSGHHSTEFFQQMYHSIAHGNVWQGEICNLARDGSLYWVDATIVPFMGANGKPRQYVSIRTDITERKNAEQNLAAKAEELARSNNDLEQFAYVASHDLQEPLRMVASYTQLLSERYTGKLDATADKFIAYASEGAMRMQILIKDLLAFSRVGRSGGVRERVNCNEVMEDVRLALAAAIADSGAVISNATLPEVWADRPQMAQLLRNLIGNAIKFRGKTPPEIAVRVEKVDANWLFSVSDNGIGIAPEYAENIFVAFQRLHARTEYPGNGIGLAICKKIVEHYGGKIWVEGIVGLGSTFLFTIPAAIPEETAMLQELGQAES